MKFHNLKKLRIKAHKARLTTEESFRAALISSTLSQISPDIDSCDLSTLFLTKIRNSISRRINFNV